MNRAFLDVFLAGAIAAHASFCLSAPVSFAEPEAAVQAMADANPEKETTVTAPLPERLQDLLIHAISLIGVKYKYGGNSAQVGFDCSGFVRHVFAESASIELPRSSYAMGKLGESIEKDDLRPGDLVFYNTLHRRFSHVGIYLGEGRFVHAPSRGKTVEIVDMSDRYWKNRFNGARRLVNGD
ncbi:MAG: C40 family peptidase [Burkholderiales bacterium]|nr:C40 family peptidase [Burkholderiales bacterium]